MPHCRECAVCHKEAEWREEEAELEGLIIPEKARHNRLGHTPHITTYPRPKVSDLMSHSSSQEGREK